MTTSRYDTIVIGAGQAGPGLALALAERGERVALVEADRLGGTCLNSGCRPSKALIASARAAHVARSSGHLGVRTDAVRVDLAAIVARKDALVGGWRDGYADLLGAHDNIDYIEARATFTGTGEEGHHLVAAADQTLGAPRVVINSGARSVPPPIPGLETVAWLDHHGILDLTELPEHLVVLGGSYMGLEFAQAFARLGSEVTVIDLAERIVVGEDPEISEAITAFLTDEGLEIHTGTAIDRVSSNGRGIALELTGGATKQASHLLIAAGRVPNSEALGLDTVGWRPASGATSRPARSSRRTSKASTPSATSTVAVPSPTPPTRTTRSSPTISRAVRAPSPTAP